MDPLDGHLKGEEDSRSVWKKCMIMKEGAREISSMRETLIGTADFEDGGGGARNKGIPDSSIEWENPQLTVSKEIGMSVPQLQWREFFQQCEGAENDFRTFQSNTGLPKWLSGKESTSQGRRHSFDTLGVAGAGSGDPLEEERATHFSILAFGNPRNSGAWQAAVRGVARVWHDLSIEQQWWQQKLAQH